MQIGTDLNPSQANFRLFLANICTQSWFRPDICTEEDLHGTFAAVKAEETILEERIELSWIIQLLYGIVTNL